MLHLTFYFSQLQNAHQQQRFKASHLKQFLWMPDEERYAIIQFLNVFLQITCHHLQHKENIDKQISQKLSEPGFVLKNNWKQEDWK